LNEYLAWSESWGPYSYFNSNAKVGSQIGGFGTFVSTYDGIAGYFSVLMQTNLMVNNTLMSIQKMIPQNLRTFIGKQLGLDGEINSIDIDPNEFQILWRGFNRTLKPETEIRALRHVVKEVSVGNFAGAANDIVSILDELRKYGSLRVNGKNI
jgi:hypothetical protein